MKSLRITGFSVVYFIISFNYLEVNCVPWPFGSWDQESRDDWNGNWFPNAPGTIDKNPTAQYKSVADISDVLHGVQMGIPTYNCDDGKSHLDVDWNNSPVNYTCFDDRRLYKPHMDVSPEYSEDHIPANYHAPHKCMSTSIAYDKDVPTFGPHRPLWARYGEYQFVPRQRWIHNLEHGAVVMLYHPCAWQPEVDELRRLVQNCLVRHIITPYTFLKPERPLALVTWGHRLLMSQVDPNLVVEFIKTHAKHGPEQLYNEGQFSYGLIERAKIVSDVSDTHLCPDSARNIMA